MCTCSADHTLFFLFFFLLFETVLDEMEEKIGLGFAASGDVMDGSKKGSLNRLLFHHPEIGRKMKKKAQASRVSVEHKKNNKVVGSVLDTAAQHKDVFEKRQSIKNSDAQRRLNSRLKGRLANLSMKMADQRKKEAADSIEIKEEEKEVSSVDNDWE